MIPEDIQKEIGFAAAKYSKYEDEGILGTNATKFNAFDDGAEYGYSLSQPKIEELEKEVERLRFFIGKLHNELWENGQVNKELSLFQSWDKFKLDNNIK